jgi:Polysaccharide pyruvyl transferase/2OG-Fe(II) oxygenase superfamily
MPAIGICGTFDVQNYGDLIFPLLARHELERRLGKVSLRPYSYRAKDTDHWPFEVRSNVDFAADVDTLDAVLLGGGDLIHCIKNIALDYLPQNPALHHPTSLWLTPALIALEQGLPLIWNAPGVPQEIPRWARAAVRAALMSSSYVAVRDESSRQILAAIAPDADVCVVPDTAFGIANLCDPANPSSASEALASQAGLRAPYVVLEPAAHGPTAKLMRAAAALPSSHQILILPIGPVHGECNESIPESMLPGAIRLPVWPDPLVLTELIAGAEGAIGDSLHLAIAAIAFGVPVFRSPRNDLSKYAMLKAFDRVHSLDGEIGKDVSAEWLRARLGRITPSAAAREAARAVSAHWDKVAAQIASHSRGAVPIAIRNLWQRLPGDLESHAELEARFAQAGKLIGGLREENAALRNSLSWKITSPLRLLAGLVLRPSKPGAAVAAAARQPARRGTPSQSHAVIHFESIEQQKLATEPYAWAKMDGLFSPEHATDLAVTFPRDRFKLVQGYDGEKDYGYHVRELIGMGNDAISHAAGLSPAWSQLATDLLSSRYRGAIGRLTGIDASSLRMEANVFHYGPGAWLGPHVDLADKVVTHVLYFNPSWNVANGGCLNILRSADMNDSACIVPPIVGSSAILVRSDKSWHAVSRVDQDCKESRRSITVTFYRADAVSTMWPPGDNTPTFDYIDGENSA